MPRRPIPAFILVGLFLSVALVAGSARAEAPLTAEDIAAKVQQTLRSLQDISLIAQIEQVDAAEGAPTSAEILFQAKLPDLFRLTYRRPEALAGTVQLIDRHRNEVRTYLPITETIIVQDLDEALRAQGLVVDPEQLLTLPTENGFQLSLVGSETREGVSYAIVAARRAEDPPGMSYRFWVDQALWLFTRIEVLRDEQVFLTVRLVDIALNQGIADQTLAALPRGAVKYQ